MAKITVADAAECSAEALYSVRNLSVAALYTLGVVLVVAVAIAWLTSFFFKSVLGYEDKRVKTYDNGVSILFALRFLFQGAGFHTLVKMTAETSRRRVYSGMKRFVFFGREIWTAGHPAVVKHIFTPANAGLWYKIDKPTLNGTFFVENVENNAMLYTGDDEQWRTARNYLTPFFMSSEFNEIDNLVDKVVNKHLVRLLKYRKGRAELLELMLFVTIDLLCEVLYGASLTLEDLTMLVESLAEYTVPATLHRGKYKGMGAKDYHTKVAEDISKSAPKGTLAHIIQKECPSMPQRLRDENCAFFLEALTPAFASFWAISSICLASTAQGEDFKDKSIQDPIFRQQCIKESLRMYPPVPLLWARIAKKTHSFGNPVYDETVKDERNFLSKLFSDPDIRTKQSITVKKDTLVFAFPAAFHYDDRFWMQPEEFLPSRWAKDPHVINENKTTGRKARQSVWGGLSLGKGKDVEEKIATELKMERKNLKSAYDLKQDPLRYKLFGTKYEEATQVENREQLKAASEAESLGGWSYFPFGLGKHTCLGRRLAVQMVDAIVGNTLSYGINFENGVTPNLFKRHWTDRINTVSAVYNYPADPVYIEIDMEKKDLGRVQNSKRKMPTMYNPVKLSELFAEPKTGIKSAVLFINCQNECMDPKGKLTSKVKAVVDKLGTNEHIKEVMEAATASESLVIHSPHAVEGGKLSSSDDDAWDHKDMTGIFTAGTWNAEFPEGMGFTSDDIVLAGKKGFDCTIGTGLGQILKDHQIERIFLAGFLSDVSVEATVKSLAKTFKGAVTVHPIRDATAAYTMDAHEATYNHSLSKFSMPVTTEETVEMLSGN